MGPNLELYTYPHTSCTHTHTGSCENGMIRSVIQFTGLYQCQLLGFAVVLQLRDVIIGKAR